MKGPGKRTRTVDGGGDGSRARRFGRVSFSVLPVFVRFSVLLHPFLRYSVLLHPFLRYSVLR